MKALGLSTLCLLGALASGCATSGVVDTALHGDLAALKRDVKRAQERDELDRGRVADLAQAVASREVRSAKGAAAIEKLHAVRPCAAPLSAVLSDRAKKGDDAAAEATLILLELGKLNAPRQVKKYGAASSGAWRAVGARAATRPSDGPLRRQLIQDPDERVRRAALSAAVDARQPDDLDALLEAARLDPDPLSRSLAVRAVGAIGGPKAALALDDLWARADETTRVTVIDAWSMEATYRQGGDRKLVRIAETEQGVTQVSAAAALTRRGGDVAQLGTQVLARAIKEGSELERRLAIQLASPDDPDVQKALQDAAKDGNKEVAVIALAKLAGTKKGRQKAIIALRPMAKKTDDVGVQARAALAAAADASIKSDLVAQLDAPTARYRTVAAVGLLRLGDYSRAATALADDDPVVRTAVACSVLSAETRPRR
ncbi:MAG: HEAT repeat domain-containing protein [Myxococcales bacterium]|nr:HEAT repeat domain-containing protein [Myxococcales bacterium]